MIQAGFNDVRHIHLTDKHSTNVKTSWYGESIGRYEGDTLVVDTIGLDERTSVDEFGTPHTQQLHVIAFEVAAAGADRGLGCGGRKRSREAETRILISMEFG